MWHIHFLKKVVDGKAAAQPKIAPSDIIFKDFACYVLRISEYFKDTSTEHLSVSLLLVETTLKSQ